MTRSDLNLSGRRDVKRKFSHMYDRFRWTNLSARRNALTMEYEPLQPYVLLALAEKVGCGTFVDVGSNIGTYSLFATRIPTIERVIAFEANPATARQLKANIALNELGQVIEVHEKAASSASGTLNFGVVSNYSGANSVVGTTIHDRSTFHAEIVVESITLDQILAQPTSRPICIKIDVEGHEKHVLEGAKAMFLANKVVLQVEDYGVGDRANEAQLRQMGCFQLMSVGPDQYYSNLEALSDPATIVEIFEAAAQQLIEYNHRNKAVTLKRGDVALQLTGKTAKLAQRFARRTIGKHL